MRARSLLRLLPALCAALSANVALRAAKPVAPLSAAEIPGGARVAPVTGDPLDEPIGEPLFNSAPSPLPPNLPSVGFEATATSEFGTRVRLGGASHFVTGITVALSSHALRSDFPGAAAYGFSHPITLKLYAVERRGDTSAPGAVLASVTQTFLVPWRPEPATGALPPLRPWRGADGNLYTGLAFPITFDLGAVTVALPPEVIVAVSFNTEHFGAAPRGVPGPYNFLHVGVTSTPPSRGTNPEPDAVFWNTALAASYSDLGATGVGILRRDTGWASYQPAVRINDSPFGLLAATAAALRNVPSSDPPTILAFVEASDLLATALDRNFWDGNDRLRPLWGRVVFDLLAETADALARFAADGNPAAPHAHAALDSLLTAAQSLAETAVGDAVIGGGNAHRVSRAQDAFDAAGAPERAGNYDYPITQLANAWREAQMSLR